MKIAILSDIHDHLEELRRALEVVEGCESLLFCGDFCAPFSLAEIAERFDGPIHVVLGNNDGDVRMLSQVAQQAGHVTVHGIYGEVELGGRQIAFVHYPRLAEGLAFTGNYDLVCHGHDHRARVEVFGHSLLVNPGEVMGWKGTSSCAIYDTETGQAELVDL